jgi:LacI family transcriptional regulator
MAVVAKHAGVHVTTVSLALRNHPSLPVSTRQRIQAAARELGYRPDPALQALIAHRKRASPPKDAPSLAYVTNWDTEWGWKNAPAHGEFYAGALAKAGDLGLRLEHFWIGAPKLTHERLSEILFNRGITGIVVASHRRQADVALHFDWSRFSGVKIDVVPHEPKLHVVTNDQRAIIQLATRSAIAVGYRRAGLVLHREWDRGLDLAWSGGFLASQLALPAGDRVPILFFADADADGFVPRAMFETWLREHRPDVLLGYGPHVRPQLAKLGLDVPRDLAFVDIFLAQPDGTTAGVRHNCRRVGELALEIMAGQLQLHSYGIPEFPTTTLVEGTWFDGGSLPACTRPGPASSKRASNGLRT